MAARVGHEGILRAVDDEQSDGMGRLLPVVHPGEVRRHGRDRRDFRGELESQSKRHEAAIGDSGRVHAPAIDAVRRVEVVDEGADERDVIHPAALEVPQRDERTTVVPALGHALRKGDDPAALAYLPAELIPRGSIEARGRAAPAVEREDERNGLVLLVIAAREEPVAALAFPVGQRAFRDDHGERARFLGRARACARQQENGGRGEREQREASHAP